MFAATAITIKEGRKELQNDTLVGLFKLKSIKSTWHVIRAFFSLLGTSLVPSPRCPQAYREHNCSYLQARHEDSCDFMIILCPSCKELMRANEQERHNERECPERTLNCKYCKDPFQLKNIKVSLFFFFKDLCLLTCKVLLVKKSVMMLEHTTCRLTCWWLNVQCL